MLLLDTFAHETIWGGSRLLPYTDAAVKRIGHLYSLCNEKGMETHIVNGDYKGKTFHEFFCDVKGTYGLEAYEEFPLILALVEAKENLSIQVHPGDDMAINEEHAQYGKNESWFFIQAPETGYLYNGIDAKDVDEVVTKLHNGEMMDIVGHLEVRPNDYVYVKAGTLHAMTAGSFVYEIEENSPWTYRLYDYERMDDKGQKRELHLDKGLRALDVSLKSKSCSMQEGWVEERRYKLLKIENETQYKNESNMLQCFTIISGECVVDGICAGVGRTIVLLPGELLMGAFTLAMVAEPKPF